MGFAGVHVKFLPLDVSMVSLIYLRKCICVGKSQNILNPGGGVPLSLS